MEENFYFALLRISVAQILKASGFDKCKPLVLNAVTSLYIKYLEKLLSKSKKFAQIRSNCANEIQAQDLTQALLDIQLIKPLSLESILDPRDNPVEPEQEFNTKSLESFVKWLQFSDNYNTSKRLSEVPVGLIHNLAEKRKVDNTTETDQERKKRRLRERQEYYNQIKHGEEQGQVLDRLVDDLDDDEITSNDKLLWLAYLAEKDLKLGHNFKFASTTISDTVMSVHHNKKFHPPLKNGEDSYQVLQNHLHNYNKNDYVVMHIQDAEDAENGNLQPSSKLKESLPYNLKYSKALVDDDILQYYKYAEEHPEEVEKTREEIEKEEERKARETTEIVEKLEVELPQIPVDIVEEIVESPDLEELSEIPEPIEVTEPEKVPEIEEDVLLPADQLSGAEQPVVTVLQEVALNEVEEEKEPSEEEESESSEEDNDDARDKNYR